MFNRMSEVDRKFRETKRLLREMPWLWAVRKSWDPTIKINVYRIDDPTHLDYYIKSRCYIYLDSHGYNQEIITIGFEDSKKMIFDALGKLLSQDRNRFECASHVVTVVGEHISVRLPKKGHTLQDLYYKHFRKTYRLA